MNDTVSFNSFNVWHYHNGTIGELWGSEAGEDFSEYWRSAITQKNTTK